jgi:hypothetical protein
MAGLESPTCSASDFMVSRHLLQCRQDLLIQRVNLICHIPPHHLEVRLARTLLPRQSSFLSQRSTPLVSGAVYAGKRLRAST